MRICIDMRTVGGRMHGIARYVTNLVAWLARLDCENDYLLLCRDEGIRSLVADNRKFRIRPIPIRPYTLEEQLLMPLVLAAPSVRPDVYHCPTYGAPALAGCPMVMNIHDLIHIDGPGPYGPKARLYYRLVVRRAANRAALVVTESAFTKDRIRSVLGICGDKVEIVPGGCDPVDFQRSGCGCVEGLDPEKPYILTVTNERPHKNLDTLLSAYGRMVKGRSVDAQLVVIGIRGDEALERVLPVDLCGRTFYADQVTDALLGRLMAGAEVFVCASSYEGFGLPVLEAMAASRAVIASKATALPEVVGDAAVLVDPYDAEGMAEAMDDMLRDEPRRKRLGAMASERARLFPWRAAAERMIEIYSRAGRPWRT